MRSYAKFPALVPLFKKLTGYFSSAFAFKHRKPLISFLLSLFHYRYRCPFTPCLTLSLTFSFAPLNGQTYHS